MGRADHLIGVELGDRVRVTMLEGGSDDWYGYLRRRPLERGERGPWPTAFMIESAEDRGDDLVRGKIYPVPPEWINVSRNPGARAQSERDKIIEGMAQRFDDRGVREADRMARELAKEYEDANGATVATIRKNLRGSADKSQDLYIDEYPPHSFGALLVNWATSSVSRRDWSKALAGKLRVPTRDDLPPARGRYRR